MKGAALILVSLLAWGCAQEKKPPASALESGSSVSREGIADCALTFRQSQLCLSLTWVKVPTDIEFGSFTFKTYRQNLLDQTPVVTDLAAVPEVILWMPSMGHGSSPVAVERVDTGTYRATNVFFVMPGEWQIKWQVKSGSGVEDEAILPITL